MKEMNGMKDNKRVSDNHQQGIERVKQRAGDLKKGQGGKMGVNLEKAQWSRTSGSVAAGAMTPRKA